MYNVKVKRDLCTVGDQMDQMCCISDQMCCILNQMGKVTLNCLSVFA